MKTRIISVVAIICMLLGVFAGCGSSDDKTEAQKAFDEKTSDSVVFSETVRDDVTGKWRLARIATSTNILDVAKDYYEAYFASDDEIHIVINFTLNTTAVLNVQAGKIFVSEYEHVDKEELSAKTLPSGMPLGEYMVDKETGAIENLAE